MSKLERSKVVGIAAFRLHRGRAVFPSGGGVDDTDAENHDLLISL
jgi:hypothetical protein